MIKKYWKVVVAVLLIAGLIVMGFSLTSKDTFYTAAKNEVVKLVFEFDKKIEFGEYYFDLSNGKEATYPLCFCLSEKNMFPPDCVGDVKYIYHNNPGVMCVPLFIGKGRCATEVISTSSFATMFTIPLEYGWTKPFETIVLGVQVPETAPNGARLAIDLTIYKKTNAGPMEMYRTYTKKIRVKQ